MSNAACASYKQSAAEQPLASFPTPTGDSAKTSLGTSSSTSFISRIPIPIFSQDVTESPATPLAKKVAADDAEGDDLDQESLSLYSSSQESRATDPSWAPGTEPTGVTSSGESSAFHSTHTSTLYSHSPNPTPTPPPSDLATTQLLSDLIHRFADCFATASADVARRQGLSAVHQTAPPRGLRRDAAPVWCDKAKRDPADFVRDFEAYANIMRWDPAQYVQCFRFMVGKSVRAKMIVDSYLADSDGVSTSMQQWDELKERFITEVRGPDFFNRLVQLWTQCRQGEGETVVKYHLRYQLLTSKLEQCRWRFDNEPSRRLMLDQWVNGLLHSYLRVAVKASRPRSLRDAYVMARTLEEDVGCFNLHEEEVIEDLSTALRGASADVPQQPLRGCLMRCCMEQEHRLDTRGGGETERRERTTSSVSNLRRCWYCGERGHVRAKCPNAPPYCVRCRRAGHSRMDCRRGSRDARIGDEQHTRVRNNMETTVMALPPSMRQKKASSDQERKNDQWASSSAYRG